MKLFYRIETIDAIIISQSPATAETHKSLDYIPGSSILGAIAANSYREFNDGNKSWHVFHSGKIKFSNAYIAQEGDKSPIKQCYPTPLSWHVPKGENLYTKDSLNSEIQNHAHKDFAVSGDVQYKQCRTGFINNAKQKCVVKHGSSTKTAINKDTETVEESQLFNYNYIQAGQRFIGSIQTDEGTHDSLKAHLSHITRLGRSRNTEFGRVKIQILENPNEEPVQFSDLKKGSLITIWLTSDCQLLDKYGFPVLAPSAEHIGLKDADLILSKSFINTHSNILYNRKRQGFDSQHTLINKGSVLVYEAQNKMSANELKGLQEKGIGINQQLGFGTIIINPNWANTLSPSQGGSTTELFNSLELTLTSKEKSTGSVNDYNGSSNQSTLIQWVKSQANALEMQKIRDAEVNEFAKAIIGFYKSGRTYNGISDKHNAGPTKNQWGLIYEKTRNSSSKVTSLKIDSSKSTDENDWNLNWDDGQPVNFQKKFEKLFFDINDLITQRQLLEKLNQYHLETCDGIKKLIKTLPNKDKINKNNSNEEKCA